MWPRFHTCQRHQRQMGHMIAREAVITIQMRYQGHYWLRLVRDDKRNPKLYFNEFQPNGKLRFAVDNVYTEAGDRAASAKHKVDGFLNYLKPP